MAVSFQVGICIDNDARKMLNGYDVCVKPLMDLSNMANVKLAGPRKRWSLASLTEMITCKEVFGYSPVYCFSCLVC
jgi:werner syndrome-like exonuclease